MSRRALITGISGQDGSYLAEFLLDKGYEVHGVVRRVALEDPHHRLRNLEAVRHRLQLHAASLYSYSSLAPLITRIKPDECYHLAAESFVNYSFDEELSSLTSNINSTYLLLAVIKDLAPECHFYFASSSEMFGAAEEFPQTERTRFRPRSPYGIGKMCGFELTRNYREKYGLHASSGILFNHESPRRGYAFLPRKVTSGVAAILAGRAQKLGLGNLDALRDWGDAREYVQAMWRMLQQPQPDDYVIATGRTRSVREFVELVFALVGLDYRDYVYTDPLVFRPAETHPLVGDSSKARATLGWAPRDDFEGLVRDILESDLEAAGVARPLARRAGS
jgi:GDPmannose 4,6-dehydratase